MTRVIDGDTVELEVRNKKKEESKGTNYGTGTTERPLPSLSLKLGMM
jgi:endonuclease YncB( thermonuclease family)